MDEKKVTWNDWENVRLIGQGGFGAVYEIQKKLITGSVEKAALKVISIPQNRGEIEELRSEGYDDESITGTFRGHLKTIVEEYSTMRRLNDCPNIVKCDEVQYEQHPDGIGWNVLIKMELLTPLSKLPMEQLDDATVIRLGMDICSALEVCHDQDIIHRDVKPQNIFIAENGCYKLGDFGIAKTVERTMGGTKIGTYKYMAPEVYHNQPYRSAADIYSLGLVLYWMLNERRLPFMPLPPEKLKSGDDEQARNRRFSGETLPAPKHGDDVLKAVVLKACAYDPKDRYASAGEMKAALQMVQEMLGPIPDGSGSGWRDLEDPYDPPYDPPDDTPKAPVDDDQGKEKQGKKKLLPLLLIAGVAVAAVALVVMFLSGTFSDGPEILRQPQDVEGFLGDYVVLSVEADGSKLEYQWWVRPQGESQYSKAPDAGANLTLETAREHDEAEVYCVITDRRGNTVSTKTVVIHVLEQARILTQPQDAQAAYGQTVGVTVQASGDGLTYEWYYAQAGSDRFELSNNCTGATYSAEMNENRDGRRVYCVITDEYGNQIQTDTVTISMSLSILTQPTNAKAESGQEVSVKVEAAGNGLTYEWYYAAADSNQFEKSGICTSDTYTVEMNESRDGRRLYCVITDANGNQVQSDTVTIGLKCTVRILTQPESVFVPKGQEAVVYVETEGDGLTYEWYFAPAGSDQFEKSTLVSGDNYTVEMNENRDGRKLYCVITDEYGNSVTSDVVTLHMTPLFFVLPEDASAEKGQTVSVSVWVIGEGLTYEWYYSDSGSFEKSSIATGDTYSVEMNEKRDGRRLYCVITDAYGNSIATPIVTITMK